MKVTSFKHRIVSVPVHFPVVSCVRNSDRIVFVLLDITTDEGVTGISYVQAFHMNGAHAICSCLNHLESVVVGKDPRSIELIWQQMLEAIKLLGRQGLPMFALSLVDIALWDIAGKWARLPVCRLLGGEPGIFPAYQSDGLWLVSPAEAARQAEIFAASGFRSLKMRLGRTDRQEDIRAVQEVRQAVGKDVGLIVDVNQGWSADTVESVEKQLKEYNLLWIEEPVDADNAEGHAKLSGSLSIPVATGENLYGVQPFHRYLQMNAASVYTPDLQRTGGISGWRRINVLLEQFGKPSSIHLFPEYAVHLFPVIRHSLSLEWMSWASHLFQEPLECVNGQVRTPERPGFGFEWNEEVINGDLLSC
ncbi:mandelate racemase/muconate lactonizing enzyme family protein [Paenibacillus sp. J2TS4]|uniref:mandelate racemase/muconate lactonizing enzyme family protein n=1 Tax=Paenibacillus sp. J2TS4 TaxID=2807194 RepID=UPI001B205E06|nr:mandelate racemase/muconate lactonizing enzyme family protein [Paenibacillus sp. J2TS4]GIP31121.1 mandelate racemase [Paenibacillus sp. J2TS4]